MSDMRERMVLERDLDHVCVRYMLVVFPFTVCV